jgi:hypothetical protein
MTGDELARIASQDTLEAVRDRIGETGDTGGTYNSGTLTSKANAALLALGGVNNGIDGLNNRLDGMVTPYGKGTYGDLIVSQDLAWPSQDGFNRYVIHTKSMTIPEGITLKPPEKCDGLYILSQGDVTINGDIDVRGMRKTFDADLQLAPTINVGSQEFELAKGGYSPKGGKNGAGGEANNANYSATPSPSLETDTVAGNVNGGGSGRYVKGGSSVAYSNKLESNGGYRHYNQGKGYYGRSYEECAISWHGDELWFVPRLTPNTAPCAIIIIAKGKVTINGHIIATGSQGAAPTDAQDYAHRFIFGPSGESFDVTLAGDGAIPPSGGGPVTVICNTFECNGKIDTNGSKETYSDKADKRNTVPTQCMQWSDSSGKYDTGELSSYSGKRIYCSQGGFGGTFISTAGEIKVYEGVSE